MDFIGWSIAVAIAFIVLLTGYAIYDDLTSEKLTLNKAEWVCSLSEKETHLRPQLVGKVNVMVPYEIDVCKLYERKK